MIKPVVAAVTTVEDQTTEVDEMPMGDNDGDWNN
jgi:hypothetical protein